MRERKTKRQPEPTVRTTDHRSQEELDIAAAEPDLLRYAVRLALTQLSDEEWPEVNDRLLGTLKRAGVNVGQCLLLLGIAATTADELTEPDIANLIRYVRINEPKAMALIARVLSAIPTLHFELARGAKVGSRAA
jgi:hypothetical protein